MISKSVTTAKWLPNEWAEFRDILNSEVDACPYLSYRKQRLIEFASERSEIFVLIESNGEIPIFKGIFKGMYCKAIHNGIAKSETARKETG